jgi:sec-independent protein translocase protein TatC
LSNGRESGDEQEPANSTEPVDSGEAHKPPAGAEPPAGGEPVDGSMGIIDHLTELRRALLLSAVSIFVATGATMYFSPDIFRILTLPLWEVYKHIDHPQKLIFTSPPEGLLTYMKVGFFSGMLASTPFWMYFLGRFVWVGLYKSERRFLMMFVGAGSLLFTVGGVFCYFEMFPMALQVLIANYRGETLEALISIKEYFSFAMTMIIAFGLSFQLPLVMFLLGRMGIVDARMLLRGFRWAIVIIAVLAAVLTTPDVISQASLGIPMVGLYFLGVLSVWLFGKKRPPADAGEPPADEKPAGAEKSAT